MSACIVFRHVIRSVSSLFVLSIVGVRDVVRVWHRLACCASATGGRSWWSRFRGSPGIRFAGV